LGEVTEAVQQILTQRQADEAERARIKAEHEAEAARIAAERAELERRRAEAIAAAQAEQAKAKAEADKLAAERTALEAARAEFEQRQRAHEERERARLVSEQMRALDQAEDEAIKAKPILVDEDGDVPLIAYTSATPEFVEPAALASAAKAATAAEKLAVAVPSAVQLIYAVAETFGASVRDAQDWLIQRAAEIEEATV
jgi:hypothetical protein